MESSLRLYEPGSQLLPGGPTLYFKGELQAFRPPPKMVVSTWADERRILQPGTSRQPGPWRTETTPYLKEPMDAFNDPNVRHVVLCFGTQLGKTEALYNMLGFIIDLDPYSTIVIYPRENDAKSVSRSRIQPMINATPELREKKPKKEDHFQTLEMYFPGMALFLVGANSAAALSQKPARNLLRDEVDKYPDRVGKDADPLSLSEERTKSFWDIRKIIDVSSPTIEERGIWKMLKSCDEVREFRVACPFCGHFQALEFNKGIKFESKLKSDQGKIIEETDQERISRIRAEATLICQECEESIGDEYKPALLSGGKWIARKESKHKPEKIGFHLSSLYSPWLTWGDIAAKFIEARIKFKETGDTGPYQNIINGWFAEPWIIRVKQQSETELLERRTELPPDVVPAQAIALTMGVDVQKYGFYFTVWAWERAYIAHLISYGQLNSWEEVFSRIYESTYEIEGDDKNRLGIWRACIDTGGGESGDNSEMTRTEETYHKLRTWPRGVLFGIKGLSKNKGSSRVTPSAIDKMQTRSGHNRPIPGGLTLYLLDTAKLKDLFFWRLSNSREDPQSSWFHAETGPVFIRHLLSEERRQNKLGLYEWKEIRRNQNHYLDASVYAHAAADQHFMQGLSILPGRVQARSSDPVPAKKKEGDDEDRDPWIGNRGRNWLKR